MDCLIDRYIDRQTDRKIGIGNEWKTRTTPAKLVMQSQPGASSDGQIGLGKSCRLDHVALPGKK